MASKQLSENELTAALQQAREALGRSEQTLSELLADTQPTTDLATEERRVRDLAIKEQALRRVIVAQRAAVEDAQRAVQATVEPRLRAGLAAVRAEVAAVVEAVEDRLWELYAVADQADGFHQRIGNLMLQLGDSGYASAGGEVRKLHAARNMAAAVLEGDFGTAMLYAGPGGHGLKRRDRAAEQARREQTAKAIETKRTRERQEHLREEMRRLEAERARY